MLGTLGTSRTMRTPGTGGTLGMLGIVGTPNSSGDARNTIGVLSGNARNNGHFQEQ